jgi:hypothetical protein
MRFTRFAFAPLVVPSLLLFGCTEEPSDATTFMPDDTSGTSDTMATMTTNPSTSTSATTDDTEETTDPSTTPTTTETADSSSTNDDNDTGSLCGDGIVSGNEECDCGGFPCDEMSLGGMSCVDVKDPTIPGVITGGELGCNMASCRFDTSLCTYCGDEEVNGIEECEEDEEITTTCEALGAGAAGPLVCDSSCQIDTSGCTDCAFVVDFEVATCPNGFSTVSLDAGASASTWACGEPTVYALGPGVAAPGTFGTNLSGPYNANEISALVSPEIDMSDCKDAGLVMTLRHWHNWEGGASNADGGIVQASENGVDWTTIAPTGGDLYDDSPITATYAPVNGVLGFSGSQDDNQWSLSTFDLSDYAGSTSLQLRFVMGSNASTQQGGWYIDYIEILGSGS